MLIHANPRTGDLSQVNEGGDQSKSDLAYFGATMGLFWTLVTARHNDNLNQK